MSQISYRKCLECNTLNENSDYCQHCGAIINIVLKRKLESEEKAFQKLEQQKLEKPSAITTFLKGTLKHPNLIVRLVAKTLYSIWMLVMMIGAALAFVFSYIAA
ncbi:hypothetical protein HCG49_10885 [Arenibacter sp. 6A1]|uniref:hypothetical protein n=1 Tax=Arenibacter sp. 6A1 TaxID=2720391 RepID=UPI0014466DEA|nr:hypothetical protein [Arenibacter sp. 6A1]NKI27068.1 hypothetical protein [Arenibacter sp. 6A1]